MSEANEKNGEIGANEDEVHASAAPPPDPLAEARAETQRFRDQWMRAAADLDNFRKRTRRELEDVRKAGREDLLKELLPVFDNLERALASSSRTQDVKAVADGLQMVLRQFLETLSRTGISKVPGVGNAFDPTIHEAIQQVETDDHPPGTIVAEVQPGYVQGDRLIRAAMVVVAKPKPKAPSVAPSAAPAPEAPDEASASADAAEGEADDESDDAPVESDPAGDADDQES